MTVVSANIDTERNPHEIIFQINDIDFVIPPTNISVRKEDMMWQWKTLRTKVSTKIPSGHGVVQVSVRLIFTPDIFLHMHRLICQFKQSPFCYVESRYLRDAICPSWPKYQNMAFTMTNLTVQNYKGSPGTFVIDLDLRWFNYSPYAFNWLYRDEWATLPFKTSGETTVRKTIDTFGAGMQVDREGAISFFDNDPTNFVVDYDVVSERRQDITGGRTIQNMIATHAGEVFDLAPRPQVMRKAAPVLPQFSNVYKRYCNYLQQKNLFECFGVDVADIFGRSEWIKYTKGAFIPAANYVEIFPENEGIGVDPASVGTEQDEQATTTTTSTQLLKVTPLHLAPRSLRNRITDLCMQHTMQIDFLWTQYLAYDYRPDIVNAIDEKRRGLHTEKQQALRQAARNLEAVVNRQMTNDGTTDSAGNAAQGIQWTYLSDWGEEVYSRTGSSQHAGTHFEYPSASDEGSYFFHPPTDKGSTSMDSHFFGYSSWRKRGHQGLDTLGQGSNGEIYAPIDGVLKIHAKTTLQISGGATSDDPRYYTIPPKDWMTGKIYTRAGETDRRMGANQDAFDDATRNGRGRNGYGQVLDVTWTHEYEGGSAEYKFRYAHLLRFADDIAEYENFGSENATVTYSEEAIGGTKIVTRGQIIGYVGTTGASTGDHLHMEVWRNGVPVDPALIFSIDSDGNFDSDAVETYGSTTGVPVTPGGTAPPSGEEEEGTDVDSDSDVDPDESGDTDAETNAETDGGSDGDRSEYDIGLSEEERQILLRYEEEMVAGGWVPYEDSQDVNNVMKRTVGYTFLTENPNFFPGTADSQPNASLPITQKMYAGRAGTGMSVDRSRETMYTVNSPDNLVVTNVIGSLSHIVASIPLLGHEFPTHQHLGSVEPSYVFEFVTSADSLRNDNVSEEGALLEYMRSELQKNSRKFRPIPGGHAVATKSFITRLLGSYREQDFTMEEDSSQEFLKKRTVIHRTSHNTVEGHAGMSSIVFEMSETNPYDTEVLSVSAPSDSSRDDARKEILLALYALSLSDEGMTNVLINEIGDVYQGDDLSNFLEEQNIDPESFDANKDFSGLQTLVVIDDLEKLIRQELVQLPNGTEIGPQAQFVNNLDYVQTEEGSGDFWEAMLGYGHVSGYGQSDLDRSTPYDNNGNETVTAHFMTTEGRPTSEAMIQANDNRTGTNDFYALSLNSILQTIHDVAETELLFGEMHTPVQGYPAPSQVTLGDFSKVQQLEDGRYLVNATDFYSVYPEQLGGDGTGETAGNTAAETLKQLYKSLSNILRVARFSLKESDFVATLTAAQISAELFDLPEEAVEGKMWSAYIEWVSTWMKEVVAAEASYDNYESLASNLNIRPDDVQSFVDLCDFGFEREGKLSSSDEQYLIGKAMQVSADQKNTFGDAIGDLFGMYFGGQLQGLTLGNYDAELDHAWADNDTTEALAEFENKVNEIAVTYTREVLNLDEQITIGPLESFSPKLAASLTFDLAEMVGEGKFNVRPDIDEFNDWFFSPQYLVNNPNLAATWAYLSEVASTAGIISGVVNIVLLTGTVMSWANGVPDPVDVAAPAALGASLAAKEAAKKGLTAVLQGIGTEIKVMAGSTAAAVVVESDIATEARAGSAAAVAAAEQPVQGTIEAGEMAYQVHSGLPVNPSLNSIGYGEQIERGKLSEIRNMLIELADSIMGDPSMLAALGLDGIELPGAVSPVNEFVGQECYPDLDLPRHPYYYGKYKYATSPDFYMWNIYEDAGMGVRGAVYDAVLEKTGRAVQASYDFHKRTQKEGLEPENDGALTIFSGSSDITPKISKIVSHPEGSDSVDMMKPDAKYEWLGGAEPGVNQWGSARLGFARLTDESGGSAWVDTGPTQNPYYGSLTGQGREEELLAYQNGARERMQSVLDNMHTELSEASREYELFSINENPHTRPEARNLTDEEVVEIRNGPMISLSSTDGSPLYASAMNADLADYVNMASKMRNIEAMMGSREGYLGEVVTEENAPDLSSEITDTRINAINEFETFYTPANLKNIAANSAIDVLSEKISMKRAFPTFKLYFIEEDEHESRFLNMDDFYSYNGVKEFTFHATRVDPGDTATIVLQNINGTLDGTRKHAIVDLDYFDEEEIEDIAEANPTVLTTSEHNTDPAHDQPFSSVVLRPGMNIQLRVGYSNDPNALEVLLNGRLTDLSWNTGGDLVQITVQSFGTQLTQKIKGVGGTDFGTDWANKKYYTTHQLLGHMMIQPEVTHFGRWEYGQLKQIGEDKNADLDFYPYAREGYEGNNPILHSVTDFVSRHKVISLGLATGMSVLGAVVLKRAHFASLFGTTRWSRFWGGVVTAMHSAPTAPVRALAAGWRFMRGSRTPVALSNPSMRLGASTVDDIAKSGDEIAAALNGMHGPLRQSASKHMGALRELVDMVPESQRAKALERLTRILNLSHRGASASAGSAARTQRLLAAEINTLQGMANVRRFAYWPNIPWSSLKGWAHVKDPLWAVGKVTLGNLFFKGPVNMLRLALPVTASAMAMDWIFTNTMRWGYDNTIDKYRKHVARVRARLKMTPADDNLFPPNPASYMTLGWWQEKGFWDKVGAKFMSGVNSAFDTALGLSPQKVQDWYTSLTAMPHASILDKRLRPGACQYTLQASTIWEVFEEMALRHPGWIYAVRPYGTKFRNTMFFGVPSQRYWSRPGDPDFVNRMNKIYRYIGNPGDDIETIYRQMEELYGGETVTAIKEQVDEEFPSAIEDAYLAAGPASLMVDGVPVLIDPGSAGPELIEAPDADEVRMNLVKNKFVSSMMAEFIKGMEQRFVPFRRWHNLTSEQDIVHNGVVSSEANVVNSVNVQYKPIDLRTGQVKDQEEIKTVELKASSFIPDNMLNTAVVSYPNCVGHSMALRYGQSALMFGLKNMYKGEILVLGNPRIRPWDVCIIQDAYNDITGPVEVESVVHMFSHETGFLTEIKPNAVTIANEISTWPVLEALKLFTMAVRSSESSSDAVASLLTSEENAAYGDDAGETLGFNAQMQEANPEMYNHFMTRYAAAFGVDNPIEEFRRSLDEGGGSNFGLVYDELSSHGKTSALGILGGVFGIAATAFGIGKGAQSFYHSWGALSGLRAGQAGVGANAVNAFRSGTTGIASLMFGTMGLSAMTSRGEAYGKSAAWLIGHTMIWAKCMEEETVNIIPLLKGSRPIVAGLTLKNPSEVLNSILGNITTAAEDTMNGMRSLSDEWEAYREHTWAAYEEMSGKRAEGIKAYLLNGVALYNWRSDGG